MRPRAFQIEGRQISVSVSGAQKQLLHSRSFQGRRKPLAGNFAFWDNLAELVMSDWFRTEALPALLEAQAAARDDKTFTVELHHPDLIGWTSIGFWDHPAYMCSWDEGGKTVTKPADVGEINLTEVTLSQKLRGLVPDTPAPMTHKVTFIAKSFTRHGKLVLVLLNARPGIATPDWIARGMRSVGKGRKPFFVDYEEGIDFWEFGAEGDDPADPLWPYGRHLDNDPRVHLLTGKKLPDADIMWVDEDGNEVDPEPKRIAN